MIRPTLNINKKHPAVLVMSMRFCTNTLFMGINFYMVT